MTIYLDDHPLRNKYLFVENKEIYECYFKCENCVFKICAGCYNNNYHLKYNIDKCAHCNVENYELNKLLLIVII